MGPDRAIQIARWHAEARGGGHDQVARLVDADRGRARSGRVPELL
jgi:hypothetical protein